MFKSLLTKGLNRAYDLPTNTQVLGGFLQARFTSAQEGLCQNWYMPFFMPSRIMVGGILGGASLASRRSLCKPDLSPAAQVFAGFDGGLLSLRRSHL